MKQTSINFDFTATPPSEVSVSETPEVNKTVTPSTKVPMDVSFTTPENTGTSQTTGKRGRMKIADMEASVHRIEIPSDEILFKKSYYSMREVTEMFKVNHSLLRFWENEFSILKPKKNAKGDRFFRPEDVKSIRLIYHLLRERKYTIQGAKDFLKKNKLAEKKFEMIQSLKQLQQFLQELKTGL